LPDLISSNLTFCQDFSEEEYYSDSSLDSDHGKNITHYCGENDIYEINKNREEEIRREEAGLFFIEYGQNNYYQDNYEGIYKKTIKKLIEFQIKNFLIYIF